MAFLIQKNFLNDVVFTKYFLYLCSLCAPLEILLMLLLIVQLIYRVQEP